MICIKLTFLTTSCVKKNTYAITCVEALKSFTWIFNNMDCYNTIPWFSNFDKCPVEKLSTMAINSNPNQNKPLFNCHCVLPLHQSPHLHLTFLVEWTISSSPKQSNCYFHGWDFNLMIKPWHTSIYQSWILNSSTYWQRRRPIKKIFKSMAREKKNKTFKTTWLRINIISS